jgi:DNA-binding transcriptional ArsR family regulator
MLSGGTSFNAPSGTDMVPSSSELISAVSHPTRRQILHLFVADSYSCASAGELAAALGQPVAKIDYHLRSLARGEIVRLNQDIVRGKGGKPHYGWSLGIDPEWLRAVLDVWSDSAAP